MKYIQTLIWSILFSGYFCGQSLHAQQDTQLNQNDFLAMLVQAKNHSEFKTYTSDALFLYKIEGEKLCVYANGNDEKPIQTLYADAGYTIKEPFAITLAADESRLIIMAQGNAKILTFRRNPKTGYLTLEEEKVF